MAVAAKSSVDDLAIFGGRKVFSVAKSTSSLAQPEIDIFLKYSKLFFEKKHYTNNGVLVRLLEERLARFHEVEFCITFCSGFWALALAMKALALKGKSEIVMPSLTYRRMADVAAWVNLTPRFCEVDSKTLALSEDTVRQCINDQTALILGVHPIVNCCDVSGLVNISKESSIPLLFDSVESMFESIPSGKVGQFGEAECFSMHASKLLNGFEGGYITTNNVKLAKQLSLLRSFGFEGQDNCIVSGGLNAKLNEIHAGMALANLDVLEDLVADNKVRYKHYQAGLEGLQGVRLIEFDEDHNSAYKNILIELLDSWPFSRDQTVSILNAESILARAYYSPALHQKTMLYPNHISELPVTSMLASRFLLLPCGDFISDVDIEKIVSLLKFMSLHADNINAGLKRLEEI